jgi:GT2 family glycosyltransferase
MVPETRLMPGAMSSEVSGVALTEPRRPSACLLILNYNGVQHLEDCLSSALLAARSWDASTRVVLVDNHSTDDSVAFTRARFPSVDIVVSPRNDFLFSLNAVAVSRPEDLIVVLNNDMRFDAGFIAPLAAHFERADVCAVGSAMRSWEGDRDTIGPRCARVSHCWFYKWWRTDVQETSLTLEACGGAVAYRRRMFVELEGFDSLYRPGYYEDLDVSYRAWASGWTVLYEPRSVVYHKVSISMLERYGPVGQLRMMYRNHVLFTVKNVGGVAFLAGFLAMLPIRAVRPLLRGDSVPLVGLLRAIPRLPTALARRLRRAARPLDLTAFEAVRTLKPRDV